MKRIVHLLIGVLGLLLLAAAMVYTGPAWRFSRAVDVRTVSGEHFATHCTVTAQASAKERDCYRACKPLEPEVDARLSVSPSGRLKARLGPGFAPLLDVCLPFFDLPEYPVLDRVSGTIAPQRLTGLQQLTAGVFYGDESCPPLYLTRYAEVLPVLTSTFTDPASGLALKDAIAAKFQALTSAAGPINDDPDTGRLQICTFIKEYDIDVNQVAQPVSSFRTMNQFFARTLTPGARTVDPDSGVVSSPADSRMVVYRTVAAAQRLWIKGKTFTLGQFLDADNSDFALRFPNPSVLLFRLSIDDYHRFHAPLTGRVVAVHRPHAGELYSVQPAALDNPYISVLSQNRRVIIELENEQVGRYLMIPVGATEVGSIVLEDRSTFAKGEEMGHFELGGSLVALVFPAHAVAFDEDLLRASEAAVEARVLVGERVGVASRATTR